MMLGDIATPADVAALRAVLGLDRPLPIQFMIFMERILVGDLGNSIFFNQPVARVPCSIASS